TPVFERYVASVTSVPMRCSVDAEKRASLTSAGAANGAEGKWTTPYSEPVRATRMGRSASGCGASSSTPASDRRAKAYVELVNHARPYSEAPLARRGSVPSPTTTGEAPASGVTLASNVRKRID